MEVISLSMTLKTDIAMEKSIYTTSIYQLMMENMP